MKAPVKTQDHPTPHPLTPKGKSARDAFAGRMPEHHSTDKPAKSREDMIDKQMQDSFPASDPPSFSGGKHIVGAPEKHKG